MTEVSSENSEQRNEVKSTGNWLHIRDCGDDKSPEDLKTTESFAIMWELRGATRGLDYLLSGFVARAPQHTDNIELETPDVMSASDAAERIRVLVNELFERQENACSCPMRHKRHSTRRRRSMAGGDGA